MHLVAVLFGATGVLGELITADPAFITWGRAAFAVVALTLFGRVLLAQPRSSLISHGRWGILLVSGIVLALHWVTFFYFGQSGGGRDRDPGFREFPCFYYAH